MSEYIERGALLELETFLQDADGFEHSAVLSVDIRSAKSADVVEVEHGHWEEEDVYWDEGILCFDFSCSLCGEVVHDMHNYCPECGAKMDGE